MWYGARVHARLHMVGRCTYTPESDLRNLPPSLSTLLMEANCLKLNQSSQIGLISLASLPWWSYLSLLRARITHSPRVYLAFMLVLGVWTLFLTLILQALYPLTYFSSPILSTWGQWKKEGVVCSSPACPHLVSTSVPSLAFTPTSLGFQHVQKTSLRHPASCHWTATRFLDVPFTDSHC